MASIVTRSMPGAAVAGDLDPRSPEEVPSVDLVEERVESAAAALLGRAVQLPLQRRHRTP
jgi:hypothetical protein